MTLGEVVEAVKRSEKSFLKLVSANDAGSTGGHQGGIYVPKTVVPYFLDQPREKGENFEKFITINWPDGETESRFIYYGQGTRNEYRITRLRHDIKEGDLIVLSQAEGGAHNGFIIEGIHVDDFLQELGLKSGITDKGYVYSGTSQKGEGQMDMFGGYDIIHEANFKSRARLLPQLGDMLIKSEDVAFIELVKNSYDAEATEVTVLMDKIDQPDDGIILIEDNGYGMDAETVINVWLELGSDYKVHQLKDKALRPKGEKGRVPIGEKGIGRLGAHKLGNNIELISKKAGKKEVHVNIDWRQFDEDAPNKSLDDKKYIEDVKINVVEKPAATHFIRPGSTGTFISISELKFEWTRLKLRNIQRTITSISSPFQKTNEAFKVDLKVLDKPGWLNDIVTWDNIKDFALYRFQAKIFKDSVSEFHYQFRPYSSFERVKPKDRDFKLRSISEDSDKSSQEPLNDSIILSHHLLKRKVEEKDKERFVVSPTEVGEIQIEGYIFDLESYVLKQVFDRKGLKDYLKTNSGVKVYRSGMRVYNYGEPDNDWLDLNLKRVNSPGEKVSNNIIMCGVFLDREASRGLKEKTNREGFIENQHVNDFKDAVTQVIEIAEVLRASDKRELRDKYGPSRTSEPVLSSISKLQSYILANVKDEVVAKEISNHLLDLEGKYKLMQERLLRTSSSGLGLGIVLHEVEKIIKELYEVVVNDKAVLPNVLGLVERLSRLIKGYSEMFGKATVSTVTVLELIEDSLFSVEFRLKKHKVNVIRAFEPRKHIKLSIAKGLIEGVIINLIDNSIYWLEVALEEHRSIKEKKLFIDVVDNGNSIEIVVADNGTGFLIPTDKAIEPMESAKKVGLGLGLNIAHEIMLAQNGALLFPDFNDFDIPEEFRNGALVSLQFNK